MVSLTPVIMTNCQRCLLGTVSVDVPLAALQGVTLSILDVVCRFAGVRDALCVWRCIEFFVHDPRILVGQPYLPPFHPLMALPLILLQIVCK